ncbi:MAG: MlaD family protein [Bacteriovoracia bacterium]
MAGENIRTVKIKVGLFSLAGLALIGVITVFVNDRPFWWRGCELVHVNIEDATGLKTKSPIRSLGLQIGYLHSVELFQQQVRLGICITAPVEVLPDTRAYVKGEGFLGDKFVELKPVKYVGQSRDETLNDAAPSQTSTPAPAQTWAPSRPIHPLLWAMGWGVDAAWAAKTNVNVAEAKDSRKEIPVGEKSQDVQELVNEVNGLVGELSVLTNNLKTSLNPVDMQRTMQKLNRTLENAAKTLSPEGNLTTTAQRALAKLEDAIEQMRDMVTRINQGEGSVGMVINDPSYAEELRDALRNLNSLLSKVSGVRFQVDVGAEALPAYSDARGWFRLGIWPSADRYYLLGLSVDPRGKTNVLDVTTTAGTASTTTRSVTTEQGGILLTAMLGKVFWHRLDFSAGIYHGDATLGVAFNLGPQTNEELLRVEAQGFSGADGRGGHQFDGRANAIWFPSQSPYLKTIYIRGGVDSVRQVNGKFSYSVGAGISFNDRDIKMLFALR